MLPLNYAHLSSICKAANTASVPSLAPFNSKVNNNSEMYLQYG